MNITILILSNYLYDTIKIVIMITRREQILLIEMSNAPVTFKSQKIYKNRVSFYKAIWKLRDCELIYDKEIKLNGRMIKEWRLRMDGQFISKILGKSG
jgi:hypothetical protein